MPAALAIALLMLGAWALVRSIGASGPPPPNRCINALPAADRDKALDALAGNDPVKCETYAAQLDARGDHCAAKELRARAAQIRTPPLQTPETADPMSGRLTPLCEAAVAHLPNDPRRRFDGTDLPSLQAVARDAVLGGDPKALRRVADMLADPAFADAYQFAAGCLRSYAAERDRLVILTSAAGAVSGENA